ncbi:MAG: hypothetical protein RIC14_00030 [Filomicrobium sp.]
MNDHFEPWLNLFTGIGIVALCCLTLWGVANERAYSEVNRLYHHDGKQWVFQEDFK